MADVTYMPMPQVNTPLPGVPTNPVSPYPTNVPTFQTILDLYKNQPTTINAMQPIAGGANFQSGLDQLAPSTGLRPEIQNALDLIKARGDENKATNVAQAQSLAARRGITGSSTELFGTTQAQLAGDKATQDSSANLLLANAQREQALQDARAKAYFDRSGTEASLGAQLGINAAQLSNDQLTKLASLTSDEIASLRNMDFGNRQLTLEALLGQQGLDIARANVGASQNIAQQQAQYGLIGSLGSALLPGLLFGGGGGAGGAAGGGLLSGLGGLFGGGGGGVLTGAGTGLTGASSSLFPGGLGAGGVGTGVSAGGGIGLGTLLGSAGAGYLGSKLGQNVFGGGNDVGGIAGGGLGMLFGGPVGAGIGSFLGTGAQRLGEGVYKGAQDAIGNTGASLIKPFVDPVGTIQDVGSKAVDAVKSVFPF